MADLTLVWTGQQGDWAHNGADLLTGRDLESAVLISLFTDTRAPADAVIPDAPAVGLPDPRGWWGDLGADTPIGSRLWLYSRAKQTVQNLAGIKSAIQDALQWLIDDAIAAAIAVDVELNAPGYVASRVTITQPDGVQKKLQYQWAWEGIAT